MNRYCLIALSLCHFFILGLSAQDLVPFQQGNLYGYKNKAGKIIVAPRYTEVDSPENGFARVNLNGRWGVLNRFGKEVIPPAKYSHVGYFNEGLTFASVTTNDTTYKFGLIDTTGKEVTGFIWDDVFHFIDGLAEVRKDNKKGFINARGEVVIPVIYDADYSTIERFDCGVFLLGKNQQHGLVSKEGKELTEFSYETPYQQYNRDSVEKYGIINLQKGYQQVGYFELKTGKPITPCKYKYGHSFANGKAFVELPKQQGFIDPTGKEYLYPDARTDRHNKYAVVRIGMLLAYQKELGKEITPAKYYMADLFNEGFAVAGISKKGSDGKPYTYYGLVDTTGKEVTEFNYVELLKVEQGRSRFYSKGKYGFIDTKGRVAVPAIYDDAFSFKGEFTLAKKKEGWGIINRNGKEISAFIYEHNWGYEGPRYCPDYMPLKRNGKDGLVETATGKVLTPFRYSWMELTGDGKGNIVYVRVGLENDTSGFVDLNGNEYINASNYSYGWMLHKGRWGYVNSPGKILTAFKYDRGIDMNGNYAMAHLNGKWGLIDTLGKEVLACVHDTITIENENLVYVKKDGKWGIFDGKLKQMTPFKYDFVLQYSDDPYTRAGVADKETWLDKNFRELTPLKYDKLGQFRDGYAVVATKRESGGEYDYLYAAIDSTGKEMFPFEYTRLDDFFSGTSIAVKGEGLGLIDPRGSVVLPFEHSDAARLNDHSILLKKNGKWALVKDGKVITAFQYDAWIEKIEIEMEKIEPAEGILALRKADKYGFIDISTGEEIGEFKYDYVWPFYGGMAQVSVGNELYFINKNGDKTEPPKEESSEY